MGIYYGTFEGYHYKFPCEATPQDCNSYTPMIRPWFLDAQQEKSKELLVEKRCKDENFKVSGFDGKSEEL